MMLVLTFHKMGFYLVSVFPSILQRNTKILGNRPKDKILVTCIIYLSTLNFLRYSVITLHFKKVNGNIKQIFKKVPKQVSTNVFGSIIICTHFSLIVFPREGKEKERRGEERGRKENHPDIFPL